MRSRTLREGSVGLLIIFSIVLFGGFALWIRGIKFGEKSYQIIADFPDVNGIQLGDGVRYRGLQIGRVQDIQPRTNGVDVTIEIDSSKLLIPRDVTVQARSSGLIGETFIDIIPESNVPVESFSMNPVSSQCDSAKIICDNTRLQGEKGITLDDLLPYTFRFSKAYGEPEFVEKIDATFQQASLAASEIANLSKDTSTLVRELQQEVANISTITKTVTDVANQTSTELTATAKSYQDTAQQINKLTSNVQELVTQNKANLVTTLDSIGTTSDRLQTLVVKLDRTVDAADTEKLASNLQELTTNATAASQNLKSISESFGNQESLVGLQQTLDSARVTFDNAQKITADLESITGDPAFVENFRTLVDGLSNLVSSSEQLEQQIKISQDVKPMQEALSIPPNDSKSAK
ncbi:MlaD family protein [Pleurocapsa sp. PCC 7319]|uniref:MlaD family protein n=1 Tax=Pleurocapsa sp. PCC 7319 TaxID=118161 RepID=UPI000348879D|nr:MlaD family protein [Pleurocapsa sp. PCC 7319]